MISWEGNVHSLFEGSVLKFAWKG